MFLIFKNWLFWTTYFGAIWTILRATCFNQNIFWGINSSSVWRFKMSIILQWLIIIINMKLTQKKRKSYLLTHGYRNSTANKNKIWTWFQKSLSTRQVTTNESSPKADITPLFTSSGSTFHFPSLVWFYC